MASCPGDNRAFAIAYVTEGIDDGKASNDDVAVAFGPGSDTMFSNSPIPRLGKVATY